MSEKSWRYLNRHYALSWEGAIDLSNEVNIDDSRQLSQRTQMWTIAARIGSNHVLKQRLVEMG